MTGILELVYFDRNSFSTATAEEMRRSSREVVFMDFDNLETTKERILSQKLDALLYLALPTEKFTVLLSQARLAPIQIQYGIGHPLSSGSNVIDYSVVSANMLTSLRSMTATVAPSIEECIRQTCSNLLGSGAPRSCLGIHYTEQLVLFDSLAYYLDDPLGLYNEPPFDIESFSKKSFCEKMDMLLRDISTYSTNQEADEILLSLQGLSCSSGSMRVASPWQGRYRLYMCMQLIKKMHPRFDRALASILLLDPLAKILVTDRAKDLVPRWTRTMNMTAEELQRRFVFIPRLAHRDYVTLLSMSSIFLNPFPFGSGITSSEALAMCVPVITLSEEISVLQFALAQIRALGADVEELLVTHDVDTYAQTATSIAKTTSPWIRELICSRRSRLFGKNVLRDAVRDWGQFLGNLADTRSI